MDRRVHLLMSSVALGICATLNLAGAETPSAPPENRRPECSREAAPFRDLDFLIGHWDFVSADGHKLGEHVYHRREQGCLILEEWSSHGTTGTGMNFVDPATGKWRQVWMSPMFHIDYSGEVQPDGSLLLEGRMYPLAGGPSAAIRGIWTKQADGSVKQEFLRQDPVSGKWEVFFSGFSRRKAA